MSDTEKKLDALISALGFNVEVIDDVKLLYTQDDIDHKGNPKIGSIPINIGNRQYKLTKVVSDPSEKDIILDIAGELLKLSGKNGAQITSASYKGFTVMHNPATNSLEIRADE